MVPVSAGRWRAGRLPALHPDLLAAAGAAGALSSVLFEIKSMLVFHPRAGGALRPWRSFLRGKREVEWDVRKVQDGGGALSRPGASPLRPLLRCAPCHRAGQGRAGQGRAGCCTLTRLPTHCTPHHPHRPCLPPASSRLAAQLPSRLASSYIVVALGLLWALLGGALLLVADGLADPRARLLYLAMGAGAVSAGAFTTHGLAGYLRFGGDNGGGAVPGDGRRSSSGGGNGGAGMWRFWQPFRGGPFFVATQVGAPAAARGWCARGRSAQ